MAKLKYLVVHCADTPPTMEVTGDMIRQWHMSPKPQGRGWDRVGYSDLIRRDGKLENLTPYDEDSEVENHEMTWGATGVNAVSRHICLAGGKGKFGIGNFNYEQIETLHEYILTFLHYHPDAKIAGHYHFSEKACPNFNIEAFCRLINIPHENILTKV